MASPDGAWRGTPAPLDSTTLDRSSPAIPPGRGPLALAALAIGLLLMAIQLWLLTVALEMFLSGQGTDVWPLAVISGCIFAGGLFMLRLLRHQPRIGPNVTDAAVRELA